MLAKVESTIQNVSSPSKSAHMRIIFTAAGIIAYAPVHAIAAFIGVIWRSMGLVSFVARAVRRSVDGIGADWPNFGDLMIIETSALLVIGGEGLILAVYGRTRGG